MFTLHHILPPHYQRLIYSSSFYLHIMYDFGKKETQTYTHTTGRDRATKIPHVLTKTCVLHCAESPARIQVLATQWTVACQASLPTGILQARTLEHLRHLGSPRMLEQGVYPSPGKLEHRSTGIEQDLLHCHKLPGMPN